MFLHYFRKGAFFSAFTALFLVAQAGLSPSVHAESSAVIELHQQMDQEVQAMESGLKALSVETVHRQTAREWAKQARDLPRGSKDRAYAHAQFALSAAQDLAQKSEAVTRTYYATSRLTSTIDRLINAQKEAAAGDGSLLNGKTKEEVQKKARQLQGVDRMFRTLMTSNDSDGNVQVKAAYQAFRIQMDNAIRLANLDRSTGIENLRKLRDTTEALAFLMRAYANRLDMQRSVVESIAVTGEADVVIRQAEYVIAEAFDILNPANELNEDMDMVLQGMAPAESTALNEVSYDNALSDRISAAADGVMDQLP